MRDTIILVTCFVGAMAILSAYLLYSGLKEDKPIIDEKVLYDLEDKIDD